MSDDDLTFIATLIAAGGAAWLVSLAGRSLFVNRTDRDNPFRMVVAAIGYIGMALIIWGLLILVARMT